MKKKVLGIVIACTILIGLLAFYIRNRQETNNPDTEETPETAVSETANADGYGEETLVQAEDGSYLDGIDPDGETSSTVTSSDETTDSSLTVKETVEQPEATATPAPVATATPQPVQATPTPVQATPQPEQSYDDGGAVPDWVDTSDTPLVSDEEYNEAISGWDGVEWE